MALYGQKETTSQSPFYSNLVQSPSVLTSKIAKDTTNNNINYLNNVNQGLTQQNTIQPTTTPTTIATTPTTQTYGLNIPTSTTNPAQNQIVNSINQTISSLTPEQKQSLLTTASGELLNRINQQAGTELALTSQANQAKETGDYTALNEAIKGIQESQSQRTQNLKDLQTQLTDYQTQLMQTYQPTTTETQLGTQIADLQQQMKQYSLDTQQSVYNLEGQGRGIVSGLVAGQQEKLQQQRELGYQSMAAQESNLLTRLGLEQEARTAKQNALTTGISLLTQNYELQTQVQDKIDEQNQSIIDQASDLSTQAKDMLTFVLEQFKGIDYDSLPEESKQAISDLATQSGLDLGLVQAGLKAVKDQQDFENQLDLMKQQETTTDKLLSPTEAATLGVPYGTTQSQAATMGIIPKAIGNLTAQQQSAAFKLADDYESASSDYFDVRDAYNRVVASAKDASAAGDLALIFNYMKVLDPNSVVRESEFATAENAGSIPERIRATYNKVLEGTRLSEVQRADFLDRSKKLFNQAQTQQEQINKTYSDRASSYDIPEEFVVRDISSTADIEEYTKEDEDYVNQLDL